MVNLPKIQSSNGQIATALPGLVTVFVGATSGIGEATLIEFARHALQPRAYFVGRSQEAGDRIAAECRRLNPKGEFNFISADLRLIRNVDRVCDDIRKKEKTINLLFLSCGTARTGIDTSEGLHTILAVGYYARTRFASNLLPLLKLATGLRRVVTVLAAGNEGRIYQEDFQARKMSYISLLGQVASMTDMALEKLAVDAPEVSFVHDYPGAVKTGFGREANSLFVTIASWIMPIIGKYIPIHESGERHLFLATSAKYPSRTDVATGCGVTTPSGDEVAIGTDGKTGSGVYSVTWDGESAGVKTIRLLQTMRDEGMVIKVWNHTEGEFKRIIGA